MIGFRVVGRTKFSADWGFRLIPGVCKSPRVSMKPEIGAGNAIPELLRSGSSGRGRPSMLPLKEARGIKV